MKKEIQKNTRRYDGFADFMRNATEDEKHRIFYEAAVRSNEDQMALFQEYLKAK